MLVPAEANSAGIKCGADWLHIFTWSSLGPQHQRRPGTRTTRRLSAVLSHRPVLPHQLV